MNKRVLRANILLFIAAAVWGATFVAQRVAMDDLGPVMYSGLRFLLGAMFLFPIALKRFKASRLEKAGGSNGLVLWGCLAAGVLMCLGINFQQIGLVYTTAGKAGFITGLYVIMVPVFGYFFGQRIGAGVWIGAPMAVVGMYLMSMTESLTLAPGDGWVLVCAVMWAFHVLVVGYFSPKMDSFVLGFGQAIVCAFLSLAVVAFKGELVLDGIWEARYALLYGGIGSVAIGFTLQIIGQKDAKPAHAAIILQLEAVVAALSGWVCLGEIMTPRSILGAALMLGGMLSAQLWMFRPGGRLRKGGGTP